MRRFMTLVAILLTLQGLPWATSRQELMDLWNIPNTTTTVKTIKQFSSGPIQVEEIYYQSRPYKGKEVWIFGYYCYPKNTVQKVPAILLVHGGGGSASLGRAILWAKRGYAVLTIDLPGKGDKRACSRSGGPDMDVPILLRTKPSLDINYLVHAVAATRNGINFLCQRKEVDASRIGMVGLSWGGVITILTNGQDPRLKTAVNVFGAGYIPEGCTWQEVFDQKSKADLQAWYDYIDPKNFLKTQHSPILFVTGTNDHCYYLPTFQKSYEEIPTPKRLLLIPNLRHRFLPDLQSILWTWLDSYLKEDRTFPLVHLQAAYLKAPDKIIVTATAEAAAPLVSGTLYYAIGNPSYWTTKSWTGIKGYYEDGVFYFGVPTSLVKPELTFYISLRDARGRIASCPIRSIFKVVSVEQNKALAISSPTKRIFMHESPHQLIGERVGSPEGIKHVYFSKKDKGYYLYYPWPAPTIFPASRESLSPQLSRPPLPK